MFKEWKKVSVAEELAGEEENAERCRKNRPDEQGFEYLNIGQVNQFGVYSRADWQSLKTFNWEGHDQIYIF